MRMLNFKRNRLGVSVLLLTVQIFGGLGCRDSKSSAEKAIESLPQIESVVSKLLGQYQIDKVRMQKVWSSDGTFARKELRILVQPEFNTLNFNHDLNQAVAGFGATAIATEKSEDKSVTMHIKKDGVIVQSLLFVVRREQ